MKIRVALVDYLNAAPLGWFLLYGPRRNEYEVLRGSPAQCADIVARGEVDVAMIPSIEYQRIPNLRILPGVAVTASNRVRSVVMVRRRGGAIRSVALDTSSRTSVVLLTILLRDRMGLNPEFIRHAPDVDGMLARCDAALLIGDAALKLDAAKYELTDLAEQWISWQHRPFVFSFWVCPSQRLVPADLAARFQEGKEWGVARREEIAQAYAGRLSLPRQFLLDYLRENIEHTFEQPQQQGLEQFFRLAHRGGLIPDLQPIRYTEAPVDQGPAGCFISRIP